MSTARGKFERLLSEWRDAEARVDALRQFQQNGGAFRLRVTSVGADEVPASILDDLLTHDGYHVLLRTGIKEAERRAQAAKQAFLSEATSESIGLDIAGNGGAA